MSLLFILGPLPVCIIFGLLPVETNDYMGSSTCFKAHGLDTFELSVNSVNLPGFPLKAQGDTYMDFYHKFLKVTNFFDNPYSNGPLTYQDFTDGNFLVVENLQRLKVYNGDLMARLKFKNLLSEKLYLVMCPIYQKRLTFDEFYNVTVSDMQVSDAAKQNEKISY